MKLVAVEIGAEIHKGILQSIKEMDSAFLAGLSYIVYFVIVVGLIGLFVWGLFVFWQIPIGLVVLWLLLEWIHALGVFIKK